MTNDRRGDAADLARELAAQLAALATPGPNAPLPARPGHGPSPQGVPDLSGPRTILENASRFAQPVLPADAPFRSLKALVLRALRIVTRDQGVFNSALHEALRTALLEIEGALGALAQSQQETRSELDARSRALSERADAQEGRLDAVRGGLLASLGEKESALRELVSRVAAEAAESLGREAGAREALGREVTGSQARLDILESRSDGVLGRLEVSTSRLDAAEARLERLQADLSRASEDLRAARLEWTTLRTELRSGTPLANLDEEAAPGPETRSASDPISAGLYADFERAFRGAESEIRRRQDGDVALFAGSRLPIADLGCGRGEFLEALRARGLQGLGCDTNPVMVARCREKGLAVDEADLFAWLRARAVDSLGGVTAYQVVEHLPADALLPFVELAVSRLAPGGRLLLETVNAESVYAMKWFWMDLTHVRPVPAPSLGRLMEACGLRNVTIAHRSPVPREESGGGVEPADPLVAALARLVFAPQDVAVTGVK
ncbi:MAG: methyltransferase domain-containing protein [Thermoanaerobaculia bacterium]|jgi:SAM-dependent methyltransferase|nr:methyltransferase domain-containing protein [Thermoanaerobaculia bacterium]